MNIEDSPLLKTILSKDNIYNAIYSLESYVYEIGLLNKDDYLLYRRLRDKFNTKIINGVIEDCQHRLSQILLSDELFNVSIYFKIKKIDNKQDDTFEAKFRALHTASLIDQICMVSMLQPLMFEESSGERKLSELSKSIPNNFYGNLPSETPSRLFCSWTKKYKAYAKKTIEQAKLYQETHEYRSEVILDIKNFFPSVNPFYIKTLILDQLETLYKDSIETLKVVLDKLLFFRITSSNINDFISEWGEVYYRNYYPFASSSIYLTRGIPAGLPQSYFFGNLIMVEIAKYVNKIFPGEAYYYVDDSVIFSKEIFKEKDFRKNMEMLNTSLESIFATPNLTEASALSSEDKDAASKITYKIEYHKTDKSFSQNLDTAYKDKNLPLLTREVYKFGSTFLNQDDVEDEMTMKKIDRTLAFIEDKINECKSSLKEAEMSLQINTTLKFLKRYKRFFLLRKKRKIYEQSIDIDLSQFQNHFGFPSDQFPTGNIQKFADLYDEDIFLYESKMLLADMELDKKKVFKEALTRFEQKITSHKENLYFSKDIENTLLTYVDIDGYNTLKIVPRNQLKTITQLPTELITDAFLEEDKI